MNRKLNKYRITNTKQQASAVLVKVHDYKDKVMRVAGIFRVPTMRSRDILLQPRGDYLGRVHSDQMVLEMIRQERLWGRGAKGGGDRRSSQDYQDCKEKPDNSLVLDRVSNYFVSEEDKIKPGSIPGNTIMFLIRQQVDKCLEGLQRMEKI
jgi:hypothetical protein